VPHEDRVDEPELPADLHDVVRVARERAVARRVVGAAVRLARADMVERHGPVVRRERRGDERHMF
jgi:hypothetical protein